MQNLQMTRAIRLSNAIVDGLPTSAAVAALAEPGLKAAFGELLRRRGHGAAIAQNTALISALFDNSPTRGMAFPAILSNSAARTATFASGAAMAEIASDNNLMFVLASSNATIITEVLSSATAFNAIAAVPTSKLMLLSSPVLMPVSVPTMTSNTAPSGTASASTTYASEYAAWKAFDNDDNSLWNSSESTPYPSGIEWLRYSFTSDVFITRLHIIPYGGDVSPKSCVVEFSADGLIFSAAKSITLLSDGVQDIDISQHGFYKHWRLRINNDYGRGYIAINTLNFSGFKKP